MLVAMSQLPSETEHTHTPSTPEFSFMLRQIEPSLILECTRQMQIPRPPAQKHHTNRQRRTPQGTGGWKAKNGHWGSLRNFWYSSNVCYAFRQFIFTLKRFIHLSFASFSASKRCFRHKKPLEPKEEQGIGRLTAHSICSLSGAEAIFKLNVKRKRLRTFDIRDTYTVRSIWYRPYHFLFVCVRANTIL